MVRTRAESRSEPCADVAVLRPVADRTGQPRSGAISFEPNRCDLRDRLRGVSVTGGSTGKTAGHRPRLLSIALILVVLSPFAVSGSSASPHPVASSSIALF